MRTLDDSDIDEDECIIVVHLLHLID